jgi:hypothetical protein
VNAKPPQFLTDVYRDLRDRHLLIPAVALLIALVAVPILLRKPAEEVPPAPVAAAPAGDASAVTSAVLVDDSVDVRDYRKRLAKLKAKNPFEQRFGVDQSGSGDGGSDEAATTDTGTELPAAPGDVGGTTAPPADTPTSTDISSGSPVAPSAPTDTTGDDTTDTETTEPEIRFYAGRVDVTVGPIGKGKDIDNVKYLTFLPDDSRPIAAFVGLTGTGASESAVFAITSLAEVGEGDGTCAPHKPDPCQFLTLKPGESRYIKYNGKPYRLQVRDTHLVRIKDPREQASEGDDSVTEGDAGEPDGNGGTADE